MTIYNQASGGEICQVPDLNNMILATDHYFLLKDNVNNINKAFFWRRGLYDNVGTITFGNLKCRHLSTNIQTHMF